MGRLRQMRRQTGDLLAGLGSDADQVAASLQAAGVLGTPRSNRSCPVALYVNSLMGSDPCIRSVAVGPCSLLITIVSRHDQRPGGHLLVQLPKSVRRFVAAFDDLGYPDMIRPPLDPHPPVPVVR